MNEFLPLIWHLPHLFRRSGRRQVLDVHPSNLYHIILFQGHRHRAGKELENVI